VHPSHLLHLHILALPHTGICNSIPWCQHHSSSVIIFLPSQVNIVCKCGCELKEVVFKNGTMRTYILIIIDMIHKVLKLFLGGTQDLGWGISAYFVRYFRCQCK